MDILRSKVGNLPVLMLAGLVGTSVIAGEAEHPGRIAGVVIDATSGRPISGAYVGIGDFGDAGGSNMGRFAKEGRYAHAKTDKDGRFVLENVLLGDHPLVVTHPEFVRHDQTVRAREELPEAGLRIEMKPAGKVRATVVSAEGRPQKQSFIIRLETLDEHALLPPRQNPHLSTFASPAWSERTSQGTFQFTELAPGEYAVDAFRMRSTSMTYHGRVSRVRVGSGETKEIQIRPTDHRTTVTVAIPKKIKDSPYAEPVLVISRNPGLAVWGSKKFHSLEDPRGFRIMRYSLAVGMAAPAFQYKVNNLPPGTYSFFVGPPFSLQGAQVKVVAGGETTAGILWEMPGQEDVSTIGLWRLERRVGLEARPYTVGELCKLLTTATESKPEFRVDPSIRETKLQLPRGETPIWDVVERVYLDQGWRVDEEEKSALVFRPPDPRLAATCSLEGAVVDAGGQPVAGAAVVLCQQATGVPFGQGAKRTLTEATQVGPPPKDLAYVVTDEGGRFTFTHLRAGQYRLVAQSWRDAQSIKGPLEVNGQLLELRGVAENLKVSPDSTPEVVIRPLGTGVLRLDEKVPNDGTLLAISTEPPRADPILGFVSWGGPFMKNFIGGNRMPKGKTTVYGLPEGKVHVALFANDDVPGFGAAEATVAAGKITDLYVPLVAGWSDGHHDPPERLAPLVKELESLIFEKDLSVLGVLEKHGIRLKQKGLMQSQGEIAQYLDKEIKLPTGRTTTFADFMAAVRYLELQQSVRRRAERGKLAKGVREIERSLPGVATGGGYRQALFDLYEELGKNYPCFELKGIDWKAVGEELLPRVSEVKTDEQFALLCLEMVARLEDSHAQVMPGTAQLPTVKYPRWDPGFACLIDDRGEPVVYHVDKDGPAEAAGVAVGMTVLSVGGEPARKHMERRMKEIKKYSGYSSDRYLRYHAAQWLGRQIEQGGKVELEMRDVEGKAHTFTLPATLGVRYLPRRPVQIPGTSDTANVSWTMLGEKIGYVYVRRIQADLIERLDQAVGELKGARGMVVDVRGNSGGGFDARRAHRNFALEDSEEPSRPRFRGPVALLIDARCISAGEGWASWFIAKKRARVFGEATAGASSRKKVYTLTNGLLKVRYPVKAYRGSLDRPIERRGLEPDVPLRQTARDLAAGRDTVLEAAREYLAEAR